MTSGAAVDLFRHMLWTAFWISAPLMAIGIVVGVIVSLVQVATSIQDASFSSVPRLLAFLVALLVFMPWMATRLISYATTLLGDFSQYVH